MLLEDEFLGFVSLNIVSVVVTSGLHVTVDAAILNKTFKLATTKRDLC